MSTDSGLTWNQVGLISVGPNSTAGTINVMSLTDVVAADANNIFVLMANSNPPVGAYTQYVFKTTNGGTSWARVYSSTVATQLLLDVSKSYATDNTVVVSDGTSTLRVSTNGGAYFGPLAVGASTVTALYVLDQADIYVGTAAAVYKATRFTASTGISAGNVYSIANNPKDTTKASFAIGMSAGGGGYVLYSTNDCVSFTYLTAPAAGNTYVAYGPDGKLYAASSAGGLYVWGTTSWVPITGSAAATATGLAISTGGTLYASSNTAGQGIYRSYNPGSVSSTTGVSTATMDQMNNTNFSTFPAGGVLPAGGMTLVSATAGNTVMAIESTVTLSATTGYGYTGAIYGIVDTFIVAPGSPSPASNALLTTPTSVTLKWTAIAGAPANTTYFAVTTTDPTFITGLLYPQGVLTGGEDVYITALPLQQTIGANGVNNLLTPGTTYYWIVQATVPVHSPSASGSFTTALAPVTNQLGTNIYPSNGATGVPIDTTFSWPAVGGATGYQFVIAEDLGATDKFAIIDYSATTITNAHKLEETLKYNTVYWWRVRPVNGTIVGAWTVSFFTTEMVPTAATTTATTPPIVITTAPTPQINVTIPPAPAPVNVIPSYLLWAVIGVGAVLVIVVIVLIVRTRRIS